MQPQKHTLAFDDLPILLRQWLQSKAVIGPLARQDQPGFYYFDWIDPADADVERLAERLASGYVTTAIPPKKAFFPTRETLFNFAAAGPVVPKNKEHQEPFLLIGVHPCDLAALSLLDIAYAHPPADDLWQKRRRQATVIGVDCLPDQYCFCTSMGTSGSREGCDLFLTPIQSGYLAEIHSAKGEELLCGIRAKAAQPIEILEGEEFLHKKKAAITLRLQTGLEKFAEILDKTDLTEVWEQTAQRCYSCGSCNTTCPTCFCFDVEDTLDTNLTSGRRYRSWGSCQLLDFTLLAGGANTRGARRQRVAHRWYRKFLYLYKQFGHSFCTGCGRCSRACTADINIVDVSNDLIKRAKEKR